MMEFKSEETYQIKGRGTLYMVRTPFEFARDTGSRRFLGEHSIDGALRNVVAVESNALGTIAKGALIGLLVADATKMHT